MNFSSLQKKIDIATNNILNNFEYRVEEELKSIFTEPIKIETTKNQIERMIEAKLIGENLIKIHEDSENKNYKFFEKEWALKKEVFKNNIECK